MVKHDEVTGSDLEGLSLSRIMFFWSVGFVPSCRKRCLKFRTPRRKFSQLFQYLGHRGLCIDRLDKAVLLCKFTNLYNFYYISCFTLGKMHESISFSSSSACLYNLYIPF